MTNDERANRLMLGVTERLKIGNECVLHLMWEVWRSDEEIRAEMPPRARFVVERAHISGRLISKHAYNDPKEAFKAFDTFEREYAIRLAEKAFGLNTDTVKIIKPPTF